MADYKKMYSKLFWEMNNTIERFQKCLSEAEDIYIATENSEDLNEEEANERTERSRLAKLYRLRKMDNGN